MQQKKGTFVGIFLIFTSNKYMLNALFNASKCFEYVCTLGLSLRYYKQVETASSALIFLSAVTELSSTVASTFPEKAHSARAATNITNQGILTNRWSKIFWDINNIVASARASQSWSESFWWKNAIPAQILYGRVGRRLIRARTLHP